jgi:hypothetical protein
MGPKTDPIKAVDPKKATKKSISSPTKFSKPVFTPTIDANKIVTDTTAAVATIKNYVQTQKAISPQSESLMMMEMLMAVFEQQQVLIRTLLSKPVLDGVLPIDQEEKERRRSIVVCGLKESMEPTHRGKFKQDFEQVEKLLDTLDIECGPIHVYRMGKPINNKPQFLKVVLPTSFYQSQCLKNAKTLKAAPGYDGVFIRPSMTKEQRQADYELRVRLRELNKDGISHRIFRGEIVPIKNSGN